MKKLFQENALIGFAVVFGLISGYWDNPSLYWVADGVAGLFLNFLKLVSVPLIFCSIVSTISGMENIQEFKSLGLRVLKYTLLTTSIAAAIALALFVIIDPVNSVIHADAEATLVPQKSYLGYLLDSIPSNFVRPFLENQVIGVFMLAIVFGISSLTLPEANRKIIHGLFASLYAVVMQITAWIIRGIPIAVWGFIVLFTRDLNAGLEVSSIAMYLTCVFAANLIQGFIILPLFAKSKGISPFRLARQMFPALSLAFFTKSSNATLPTAMRCARERAGISTKISGFAFPLCTTLNMNACAAFILTTVLFVSMSNGVTYTSIELVAWIGVATIAALGNAGIPMGCYFLSSMFLAAMDVPLNLMGVILPFYTLIDMLETAINVWSDSCVVAVVDREVAQRAPNPTATVLSGSVVSS